ncbi:P-loop ATPase, Sll1717 family [Rhodanobacter umsongensis]
MLKLKDIYLGSTDAKNEVLSNDPTETARFAVSYVTPPGLSIEKFSNRDKYYVVGLKGTGKTALLRYVSIKLEEGGAASIFVLFKSEVDEDLRKDFSHAARVHQVAENSESFTGDDFELPWRWFIYRKIVQSIQENQLEVFQKNQNFTDFVELITSADVSGNQKSGLMKLIPTMRRGNIEISRSPKLGLEFDWDESGKAKVNFNDLVRRADSAFKQLDYEGPRLNLFFDELELSYDTTKQHQRDSRLVRDLIISVEKINAIAKLKGFDLCLYAAVRSEILVSVESLGKEINKPIFDFGSEILWNKPGVDAAKQPLLNIIDQRINNARAEGGLGVEESARIWSEYFPANIHNKTPQVYILHNSWYRPRDIVRLLIATQEQSPDETSFNVQAFEAVRKKYSSASWVEVTEELKARYKASEINGIKYIFYGFKQICSLEELNNRVVEISNDHFEVRDLIQKFDLKIILKDLFRVGVIGNIDRSRERMRFSFRGDDEILFDQFIFVHNALKAYLSI